MALRQVQGKLRVSSLGQRPNAKAALTRIFLAFVLAGLPHHRQYLPHPPNTAMSKKNFQGASAALVKGTLRYFEPQNPTVFARLEHYFSLRPAFWPPFSHLTDLASVFELIKSWATSTVDTLTTRTS